MRTRQAAASRRWALSRAARWRQAGSIDANLNAVRDFYGDLRCTAETYADGGKVGCSPYQTDQFIRNSWKYVSQELYRSGEAVTVTQAFTAFCVCVPGFEAIEQQLLCYLQGRDGRRQELLFGHGLCQGPVTMDAAFFVLQHRSLNSTPTDCFNRSFTSSYYPGGHGAPTDTALKRWWNLRRL